MKRTRKWAYVEQEAKRLAALALSPAEIARRLEVNQSTVARWIKLGKLEISTAARKREVIASASTLADTAAEGGTAWAASVRAEYALDATDEELVDAAEAALLISKNPAIEVGRRLSAMGRFQMLVKQLALVARRADREKPTGPTPRQGFEPQQRTGTDPRALFSVPKP